MRQTAIFCNITFLILGFAATLIGSMALAKNPEVDEHIAHLKKAMSGELDERQLREAQYIYCAKSNERDRTVCEILSPIVWKGSAEKFKRTAKVQADIDVATKRLFGDEFLTAKVDAARSAALERKKKDRAAGKTNVARASLGPTPAVPTTARTAPPGADVARSYRNRPKVLSPIAPVRPQSSSDITATLGGTNPWASDSTPDSANTSVRPSEYGQTRSAVVGSDSKRESKTAAVIDNDTQMAEGQLTVGPPIAQTQRLETAPPSGNADTQLCESTTNQRIGSSNHYATCISVCGKQKLIYVEERSEKVSSGRLTIVPVGQSLDIPVAASASPENSKSTSISCNIKKAGAVGRYTRQFHSSLKAGIKCEGGMIVAKLPRQPGQQLVLPEMRVKSTWIQSESTEMSQACKIYKAGRANDESLEPELRLTKNKNGGVKGKFSGFDGTMVCEGPSESIKTIANEVWLRDATTCNFGPSGSGQAGHEEGQQWDVDHKIWANSLQIAPQSLNSRPRSYACKIPGVAERSTTSTEKECRLKGGWVPFENVPPTELVVSD